MPDVKTVFLTRATTSQILITQMVGRGSVVPSSGGPRKPTSFLSSITGSISSTGRVTTNLRRAWQTKQYLSTASVHRFS